MHCSPRTTESYQAEARRHLIPALGAIPLTQLHPQHLQNYYSQALANGRADGRGGLSARTVQYHHRILSEALGNAVRMELLARNVAEAVDPPHPEHTSMATLAPDDIPAFLAAIEKTHYYIYYSIQRSLQECAVVSCWP